MGAFVTCFHSWIYRNNYDSISSSHVRYFVFDTSYRYYYYLMIINNDMFVDNSSCDRFIYNFSTMVVVIKDNGKGI